jgi:hypothetical protein
MFIKVKRAKRAKPDFGAIGHLLTEAVLKTATQGIFVLDAKAKLLPPVSQSLAALFRRQDFANLTFEKLLAPLVTAKNLSAVRSYLAALFAGTPRAAGDAANPLACIDVRLTNPDGSYDTAQYSFEFDAIFVPDEPRIWLVRVTDVTARAATLRELEDLRSQVLTQGEILQSVLQMGGSRFSAFMRKTDASMQTIANVLKKPAREDEAFRHKLEELLNEVDRIRREAAAFRVTALESSARAFEDALQDLRSRSRLSGSDFLPLAVKLDQLYSQFAMVKSLTAAAGPVHEPEAAAPPTPTTNNGTAIMEAPKFAALLPEPMPAAMPGAHRSAPAGSLHSTLESLTEHVAQQHQKQVVLETTGLQLIPPRYLAVIKNVAIQFIRNAVMHGVEAPPVRAAAGKLPRGTLRLEFRVKGENYELSFDDDGCGLFPDQVRATAVARGVVTAEAAARMRDREAIKLIFKSRYTTLAHSSSDTTHGAGMSLVRRYVHEAGGKIALASLPGHETRFKITLPVEAAGVEHKAMPPEASDQGGGRRVANRRPASSTPITNIESHPSHSPPPPRLGAETVKTAAAPAVFEPAGPVVSAPAATAAV